MLGAGDVVSLLHSRGDHSLSKSFLIVFFFFYHILFAFVTQILRYSENRQYAILKGIRKLLFRGVETLKLL